MAVDALTLTVNAGINAVAFDGLRFVDLNGNLDFASFALVASLAVQVLGLFIALIVVNCIILGRAEAFAVIRRGANWKVAETSQIEEGSRHYVEFSFRLDTSLLPRPMQIGIGNPTDWTLVVEKTLQVD